jgi:hypothetical protein
MNSIAAGTRVAAILFHFKVENDRPGYRYTKAGMIYKIHSF